MKRLSEGATAVSAVMLLLTAVVGFFFSIQKHKTKIEHRHQIEQKDDEYNALLKEAQDELRAKQQEVDQAQGIVPNYDRPGYPQAQHLDDFYFREH